MKSSGYSTSQIAEMTNLSVRQIDHWARKQFVVPSIQQAHGQGSRRIYAPEDLVQFLFVRRLLQRGWSTKALFSATATLRDVINDPNPLSRALLFDGKSTLLALCKTQAGETMLIDALNPGGQQVMSIILESLVDETRQVLHRFTNEQESKGPDVITSSEGTSL